MSIGMLILAVLFCAGWVLVVFGVLSLFFPAVLEQLSQWSSQVVADLESFMKKRRILAGGFTLALGILLIWLSLLARGSV